MLRPRMQPAQPSDPPVQTIRVQAQRAIDLAYVDEGRGPALLAIHGLPGTHRDFRWLAPALRERVRLVRIDQPGFGRSSVDASDHWPTVADAIARAADAIVGGPFAVLGHSFGAPMASAVAARCEHARAIVWLAPVGVRPHRLYRRVQPVLPAVAAAATWPVLGPAVVRLWRRALLASGFPSSTRPPEVARTLALLRRFAFADHRAHVEAIRTRGLPAMVAWSQDDPFVEPAVVQELGDAAAARVRLGFAHGGHNVQKTMALELADAIAGLLGG